MARAEVTADAPDQQEIEERRRLLRLFRDTKILRYLNAAYQLRRGDGPISYLEAYVAQFRSPPRRGPHNMDDTELLHEMVPHVLGGMKIEVAAKLLAKRAAGGGTEASKGRRLAKKYAGDRKMIEAVAVLKLQLKHSNELGRAGMERAKAAWAADNKAMVEAITRFKRMIEADEKDAVNSAELNTSHP
jgi:hypothetical protein